MHKQLYQQHGKTLPKQNTTTDGQTFMVKTKYNSRWTNVYGKENINLLRPNSKYNRIHDKKTQKKIVI